MITTGDDTRTQLSVATFLLVFVSSIWTASLMARNVNKTLPFGVVPFSRVVVRQRLFELFRLHRQLFPRNWLPELLALEYMFALAVVIVTGWFLK